MTPECRRAAHIVVGGASRELRVRRASRVTFVACEVAGLGVDVRRRFDRFEDRFLAAALRAVASDADADDDCGEAERQPQV